MRSDVADGSQDVERHLVLDRGIPGLRVAAVNVSPRAAFAGVSGKRNNTGGDIRQWNWRNAFSQRSGIGKTVGRFRLGVDGQRIESAQRARERNRIVIQAVTGANHGVLT